MTKWRVGDKKLSVSIMELSLEKKVPSYFGMAIVQQRICKARYSMRKTIFSVNIFNTVQNETRERCTYSLALDYCFKLTGGFHFMRASLSH